MSYAGHYSEPSSSADSIIRLKINANTYLPKEEISIILAFQTQCRSLRKIPQLKSSIL
jgi:hypothetical protein